MCCSRDFLISFSKTGTTKIFPNSRHKKKNDVERTRSGDVAPVRIFDWISHSHLFNTLEIHTSNYAILRNARTHSVIRKGRRRSSIRATKTHLKEINLPSVHDLITEAKGYQRGWFTKSYDDREGDEIEKKISIVKNLGPVLKKLVKGPMKNFKKDSSESQTYVLDFIAEMKQSMYQVTGFLILATAFRLPERRFILHQGMRVDEMHVGKFSNKLIRLIENFNAFAVRAIEELEKIAEARSHFAQNYLDKKSKYEEALAAAKKARSKRGWFGSKKKIPMTPELAGKPEDDVEVVRGVRARSARTSRSFIYS